MESKEVGGEYSPGKRHQKFHHNQGQPPRYGYVLRGDIGTSAEAGAPAPDTAPTTESEAPPACNTAVMTANDVGSLGDAIQDLVKGGGSDLGGNGDGETSAEPAAESEPESGRVAPPEAGG